MAYSVIKKPSDYFNTKLYTGTGATQSITGVGFQPDFTWIKNRNSTNSHEAFDSVRGATKTLYPNTTDAEYVNLTNSLTSFDSDGFTVGGGAGANQSGSGIASWNWLANGAGVANTDGSITSTVSANTTSGFSIVKFTGTGSALTAGHGLGVKPSMIIAKSTTIANNWIVQHGSLGATNTIFLDNTNPSQTGTSFWNDTEPTSSVFSLGNWGGINTSGSGIIAYCFAEKQGFSKFGSYTGNGSTDGTFVYTGFKPAFVMVKKTSGTDDWRMFDNKRPGRNVIDDELKANTSGAEGAGDKMDFLSNGVKFRVSSSVNASGTFIYMAFAEQPLVGDNPATAR
ncbi:hypothetical protein HTVC204P_gp37 [Pelagibacter phage HTVC204P]|nr:hypothetical protein HTVC204P_gp37 [Pelagibacter phage HTVC204P]